MNYDLLLLGLWTAPQTPITLERIPLNISQWLVCNFLKTFVGAWLLGQQALTGAHCGARTPLCKISNMQNNAGLTFYLESMLNQCCVVHFNSTGTRLMRRIKKASWLNSQFYFVTAPAPWFRFILNSTTPSQHWWLHGVGKAWMFWDIKRNTWCAEVGKFSC